MKLYIWVILLAGLVLALLTLVWFVRWVIWVIEDKRESRQTPSFLVEHIARVRKSDWLESQGLLTVDGCTWACHKFVRYPLWDVAPDLWGLYCGDCQEYISYDQGTLAL